MLLIVGAVVVIASVLFGYSMEGGKFLALYQPYELTIIAGAAAGSVLLSTPMAVLTGMIRQVKRLLAKPPTRVDYGTLLSMLYELFRVVQQSGVMALEPHVEDPKQSSILTRYPAFMSRHGSVDFLTDSIKIMIVGGIAPFDFELLMNEDLEVRHKEELLPSATLAKVGDALPGLGIVAAVLGVVITMGAIDGPASELGHKVGAALVGTFIGILLSYGFVSPLSTSLEHRVNDESYYEVCIKSGILATAKGLAPSLAVEFARRTIPEEVRPSFAETEELCRATKNQSQAAAVAA
jgi:chemotaxis protein MotA